MTFWNWLIGCGNPEDKVLLELKDRRIEALKETISTMEERLAIADERAAVLTENNSVLRKHRDLLEACPPEPKISKDLN